MSSLAIDFCISDSNARNMPYAPQIFIGNKQNASYLLATVISLRRSNVAILRARGKKISKAIHVAENIRQMQLTEIAHVDVGTEILEGSKPMSFIEITLQGKYAYKDTTPAPHSSRHCPTPPRGTKRYSRNEIARLRTMSIRRGVWWALALEERLLVSLAIKAIKGEVKSEVLAQQLSEIFSKLADALKNKFLRIFGYVIGSGVEGIVACAHTLGEALNLALAWACQYALRWAKDFSFLRWMLIIG